jgi:gliding motility-associated-like protein
VFNQFSWYLNDTEYIGTGAAIKWDRQRPPGKYKVKVIAEGPSICASQHTDTVTFVYPLPALNLGADTLICKHDSIKLSSSIWGKCIWNTKDTSNDIYVNKPSKYSLTIYDSAGCYTSDTLLVGYYPQQKLYLGDDFSYCSDSGLPTLSQTGYHQYLWNTGSIQSFISILTSGEYQLTATDSFGCVQHDSIYVYEQCDPRIYMPNSFTPNGDGLNDTFKPTTSFVKFYTLTIYNKWGELLYAGNEKQLGWDGKYKNEEAPNDIYIWQLKWQGSFAPIVAGNDGLNGVVTLLRKSK